MSVAATEGEVVALCEAARASALQGRLEEAAGDYQRALALDPDCLAALYNRALLLLQMNRPAEALASLDSLLVRGPVPAPVHLSRGNALAALGRQDAALAAFQEAARLNPREPLAHSNCGNTLFALGRHDEALASLERALALAPGHALTHYNHGNVLFALARFADALASYERAVRSNPRFALGWYNCGSALLELRRYADAGVSFDRALQLDERLPHAHNNRGVALLALKRPAEAAPAFERALELRPGYVRALENLGTAQLDQQRFEDAARAITKLLALAPEHPYAVGNLLYALSCSCDWSDDYRAMRARVAESVERGLPAQAPWAFLGTSDSRSAQLRCARTVGADKFPAAREPLWQGRTYAHDRIRVAYVSADFHEHATAFLMAELFERHDRQRFEWTAVSLGPDDDSAMRGRLKGAFDHFLEVRDLDDRDVARLLYEREIDVAVDLKGYTADSRMGIFAHRPAPIQVSYLGYPGTTGVPYIDYVIGDRHVIPTEHFPDYSEKVVHLPGCYQPNGSGRPMPAATPSRSELSLPETAFVYCCFNASRKITPEVFALWMRLLAAQPASVLWLLDENEGATRNLRSEAARHGVDPSRLIFAPRLPLPEHLARYAAADLFVDTFPCNAHTTASDALWAGLPVLTCQGATFAARVAASLLHAAALPELITRNLEEYESLALTLAADRGRLSALRARFAAERDTCALFDIGRYTRNLEAAYFRMWQRAEDRLAPIHFAVPAPAAFGEAVRDAVISYNRGNELLALGRRPDAIAAFERAARLNPRLMHAWYNLGTTLMELHRHEEAVASFDRALALDPAMTAAHNNRGAALLVLGRPAEAAAALERALRLQPHHPGALENLGSAQMDLGRLEEAMATFRKLLAVAPDRPDVVGRLLEPLVRCCAWSDEYFSLRARVAELAALGLPAQFPFPFLSTSDSPAVQLSCARRCAADKFPPLAEPLWKGVTYAHPRIRVAYLSADFHTHATAFLTAELFERHGREGFEWTGVSFGPDDGSPMRRRLEQAFDSFLDVRDLGDRDVARLLIEREIDIAVDLKGYTAGRRLGIFAHRVAPVQVNYLGYPGTLGAPYIDYIVADPQVLPGEHFQHYIEKVVHLPGCYQPNGSGRLPAGAAPTRPELGLPERAFVFCCFNASYKIAPEIFDIWMRLLRAVPGSVLWLLDDNRFATSNLRAHSARLGIDPARLVFAPRLELPEHLARQRAADLFVDTLPYNAHTTASDALWAGLPVLTCQGQTFAGRVGASLLHAAGLPELITRNLQEYESLAIALAADHERLSALGARLAAQRDTCALFDVERYARSLEAAYFLMWQRAENRLAPVHIVVPHPTSGGR
jgi:protein O-GlcNAc transferase